MRREKKKKQAGVLGTGTDKEPTTRADSSERDRMKLALNWDPCTERKGDAAGIAMAIRGRLGPDCRRTRSEEW